MTTYPTSLGTSSADEIRLLGQDLTADLMGKVGFGELAFWLVAMRRPTPSETRVFEAVLVALADHGFTPTAIAARLTYLSAPDSLQGALAAGPARWRVALPRRHRGLRGVPRRRGRRPRRRPPDDRRAVGCRRARRRAPHQGGGPLRPRPRPPRAQGRRPAHAGAHRHRRGGGPARPAPAAVRGRRPRARAGARPARCRSTAPACAVPRWPTSACRSRCCAGSRCSPARPACSASSPRSGAARSAWTSTSPSTATPSTSTRSPNRKETPHMAQVVAVIASTHHPFYYRASTAVGEERPPFADEWVAKIERFRETLDPGPARRARHGRQRPLPPAVARQHAPVPRGQGARLRRQLVQRGARVRPPAVPARRPRGALVAHPARWPRLRLRPRLQQRAADRPLDHLPDHHAAAGGRPADRADLHQHLRAAAAPAEALRRAGPRDPPSSSSRGRATSGSPSSAPATSPSSSAARASSARTAPTRSSTSGPCSGSRTATSTAACAR